MRILIINTDYHPFLYELYAETPGLKTASYEAQMRRRNRSLFGVADFYSRNFCANGDKAWEIHANNGPMQYAWLAEHGLLPRPGVPAAVARIAQFARRAGGRLARTLRPRPRLVSPIRGFVEMERILKIQIAKLKPDVLLIHSVSEIDTRLLGEVRRHVKLVVGQIASPLPDNVDLSAYDLMISSLPNFIDEFRRRGSAAELSRLAFDKVALEAIGSLSRDIPVSFVGSVTLDHPRRFELLEYLCTHSDIAIWGRIDAPPKPVPPRSPIRGRYQGAAWGADMYRVLARSKITVNQHISIAGDYANNMRLFEATGMGTLLITDWKSNLTEMFEPGREVVCYHDPEECASLIRYYLDHEDERARIAAAGQARTLREHTYRHRTVELSELFRRKMRK